jgi:uncharacterized membrane protein YeaQ/YmgE (transglycosylase-associated protein family)
MALSVDMLSGAMAAGLQHGHGIIRNGAGKNILVGIIGGFLGGLIMSVIGGTGITGFNLWSLVVAVIGAIILLLIVNAFKRST